MAFALLHPDEHPLGIDIADMERGDLGNAQTGAISGHQSGAEADRMDVLEELVDLGGA